MRVKDVMNTPYVVDKDITIAQAAKIMSDKGIGSLLYVEKKELKGIVTERDIIKNFNKAGKISRIMKTKVYTIGPKDDLDVALNVMKDNHIKRLPVVDKGELVGIITLTDLMANSEELNEDFIFE